MNLTWLSPAAAAAAKSLQLCPTLCDPIDGSPPGSSVHGILQARTLEWVAISSSNAWKWKVKVKSLSRVWLLATPWTASYQAPLSMGFSRQVYWSWVPLPSPSLSPSWLSCSASAIFLSTCNQLRSVAFTLTHTLSHFWIIPTATCFLNLLFIPCLGFLLQFVSFRQNINPERCSANQKDQGWSKFGKGSKGYPPCNVHDIRSSKKSCSNSFCLILCYSNLHDCGTFFHLTIKNLY